MTFRRSHHHAVGRALGHVFAVVAVQRVDAAILPNLLGDPEDVVREILPALIEAFHGSSSYAACRHLPTA